MANISRSSPDTHTHIHIDKERYNMLSSFATFGLVFLEFVDDEVHGVEDIGVEFVIGVVVEVSAAVFDDSLADQRLHCLLLHAKCLVQLLIVTLLVIRAHLILLNVAFDVFTL